MNGQGSGGLVITRKLGESVKIGDKILITVVRMDAGKCRLQIKAPKEVQIFRTELLSPEGSTPETKGDGKTTAP
jgi:carbon storage regulator CsrA